LGDVLSTGSEDEAVPASEHTSPTDLSQIDPKLIAGALSKLVSAAVGDIALVMARHPSYKHFALADLEWMVLPPVLAGQYYVGEAQDQTTGARAPIACITWGRFSPEVEQRYGAPGPRQPRLHPDDWTSGDQLWLVDIIGPAEAVATGLKALSAGPFKNAKVRVRKDASGADTDLTTLLAALPLAAPSSGAQR